MNKKQVTSLEIGQKYIIGENEYLIVEKDFMKFYGYLLDKERNPYGKKRIIGTKNRAIVKIT